MFWKPRRGICAGATGAEAGTGLETAPDRLAVGIAEHCAEIPPEVQPRIFATFFTIKPQDSDTGLGLEIVPRIVPRSSAAPSR